LHGQFGASVHLVLQVPVPEPAAGEGAGADTGSSTNPLCVFLASTLKTLFLKAGFPDWSFPGGCSEPDIRIVTERYLHFDRKERVHSESGSGWVRLFPSGVASFDQLDCQIKAYVTALGEDAASKAAKASTDVAAAAPVAPTASEPLPSVFSVPVVRQLSAPQRRESAGSSSDTGSDDGDGLF